MQQTILLKISQKKVNDIITCRRISLTDALPNNYLLYAIYNKTILT